MMMTRSMKAPLQTRDPPKKNIADPFSILELRENVVSSNPKVDKVNEKVTGLDKTPDLVIKSLSAIKDAAPLKLDSINQLDSLTSLCLKCTLEEAEAHYNENLDHPPSTINTMLKIHNDMISAINEKIKQTYVNHEKKIQRLEKEIIHKDAMNKVMQEVLIKGVRLTQHFVDIPNHKFNEMIIIIDEAFDHLKAQAPGAEDYDTISKQINMIFQPVFKRFNDLKSYALLALEVGLSRATEGEKKLV